MNSSPSVFCEKFHYKGFKAYPGGKNHQKAVCRSAFFINSELKLQCHIVQNTLLQTVLLAILPTGIQMNNDRTLPIVSIYIWIFI